MGVGGVTMGATPVGVTIARMTRVACNVTMLIAVIPAGYVIAVAAQQRCRARLAVLEAAIRFDG